MFLKFSFSIAITTVTVDPKDGRHSWDLIQLRGGKHTESRASLDTIKEENCEVFKKGFACWVGGKHVASKAFLVINFCSKLKCNKLNRGHRKKRHLKFKEMFPFLIGLQTTEARLLCCERDL